MMSELWDIYDKDANRTGRTMKRGIPAQGDYVLGVHVYLYTPDGMFLMQKRSRNKESHPGEWDVTGGAVLAGEDSLTAARRETLEEIGIDISMGKIHYISRFVKPRRLMDIFFVEQSFCHEECVLQTEEVEEVKMVSAEEMLRIEEEERGRDLNYMRMIREAVMKLVPEVSGRK